MVFKTICSAPAALVLAALAPLPAACALPQMGSDTGARPGSPAMPGQLPSDPAAPAYADLADLVIAAPVVLDATITSAVRIKGAEAATVPPGVTRYYVEAAATALIRGPGAIPPLVGYLVDIPTPDGRQPKLKKMRVLVFARPVNGSPTQVQLVTPDAQLAWTPGGDALTRRIAGELVSGDAPPAITGIGSAFHVPGSLPGEGETQVFLTTADNRPVSLNILRRPGEQPRWAVALSEIVDDAAGPPRRDTLLWYRLACGLPRDLPARATKALEASDAAVAREDYRFVLAQLGPCRPAAQPGY